MKDIRGQWQEYEKPVPSLGPIIRTLANFGRIFDLYNLNPET